MIGKFLVIGMVIAIAAPLVAHAETWQNVPAVDNQCYTKVKESPDQHTVSCALACAKSGYGIIAADGSFLKFDESGNARVIELLKGTRQKDHIRVTVDGERNGETIKVTSVSLN